MTELIKKEDEFTHACADLESLNAMLRREDLRDALGANFPSFKSYLNVFPLVHIPRIPSTVRRFSIYYQKSSETST